MENGFCRKRFAKSKLLRDVLSGNFPECEVNRMSNCRLEAFVLNLVKYTSVEAGTEAVSTVDHKKPLWWPRDVLFEKSLSNRNNKDQRKQFRLTLRQVILTCCEFFRNRTLIPKWPTNGRTSWVNDENFNAIRTRGVKRKNTDIDTVNNVKKRRTLISKNESTVKVELKVQEIIVHRPCEAVIRLQDILSPPKKPPNQQQFLNFFGLCHNNNHVATRPKVPQISKYTKLHNCPQIPLSSDVGQAIIKRENYSVPEYVTSKRLERLEWYVNKEVPKKMEPQNYEVSFVDNKVMDCHFYKFPKRQQHQLECNIQYRDFIFKLCRPLSVVVECDDLELKKKWYDSLKVKVKVSKLSAEQLNTTVCRRNFRIVLRKRVHNTIRKTRDKIRPSSTRQAVLKRVKWS